MRLGSFRWSNLLVGFGVRLRLRCPLVLYLPGFCGRCSSFFYGDNIGVMGFGPKTVTTGGKALKFWSSVRIEVSCVGRWKQGEEIIELLRENPDLLGVVDV